MKKRRVVSFLLCLLMLVNLFPHSIAAAAETDKGMRQVYLHAQGEDPKQTVNTSTVYIGDTANIYFAIDNPNKSDKNGETYLEPQYNLNGYIVKIYFDPTYFDYADTAKTSAATPIDYTIPDKSLPSSGTGTGNTPDNTPTDNTVGYYIYSLGSGQELINGKTYKTAYATIFFSGENLPDKDEDQLWYNLCVLPLTPRIPGSSDVFIEIGTADSHSLELFAKHVSDEYPSTFQFTAVNSGRHHINIRDKYKPAAPVADPVSGSYPSAQDVELIAESDCNIYYSIDGGNSYRPYTGKIPVDHSMEILAYAERKSDGKRSDTERFKYKIIPEAPYLFDSAEKKQIPNVYSENSAFTVYVSDKNTFGPIDAASEVYYTFAELSVDDWKEDGTSPETEWVKLSRGETLQKIDIAKKRTVRLLTVKSSAYSVEFSDIAWYYLSIKPAKVTANPDSMVSEEKIDVTLSTETKNAQIFYTINGEDPRSAGIPYTIPLTLNKDVTIRAAAYYDGEWSDLSTFWYVFNLDNNYNVEAFYPSGVYEGSVNVSLIPDNPEFSVVYSTDNGVTWKPYTGALVLESDTEILAKAVDPSGTEGEVRKFTYTIRPLPPIFAPKSTQFTNSDLVMLFTPERTNDNYPRYELYYTLDGTDPTSSSSAILADEYNDSALITINGYTVIKAAVRRDETTWSTVETHSYDIVVSKPVAPIATLLPGYYTHEIGGEPYTTQFAPVPSGTKIYYTVAYDDEIMPDPIPGIATEYNGEDIEIKGRTIIKAVAVNVFGVKSDIGIFDYTVTPETPVAAPSAQVAGKLPIVPVDAVEGSTVKYTIGGFSNEFENIGSERFYIDTETGEAYRDPSCSEESRLGKQSNVKNTANAILQISSELNGIESEPNTYVYSVSSNPNALAAPFADKESGTYEEINYDGKNNFLLINLYSLNEDADIEYMLNNDGKWLPYDGTAIPLTADTVMQLRAVKNGNTSSVTNYVYSFIPLPPIISLESGRYDPIPIPTTTIEYDPRVPTNVKYDRMFCANNDPGDRRYMDMPYEIWHTMSFKAYVLNEAGKKSKTVVHYYIIESDNAQYGSVYPGYPYEVNPGDTKYIGTHLLSQTGYNEGIKLMTQMKGARIEYSYSYTKADGSGMVGTNNMIYDNVPIFVSPSMADMTITAWLLDDEGNQIPDSQSTFTYVFVDLEVPLTSLEESGMVEFPANTEYTFRHHYPTDPLTTLYYTTDESDPSDPTNANRLIYTPEEKLYVTGNTTLKAVYFRSCGKCGACRVDNHTACTAGVYGEVDTYRYIIPTTVTVGGGGGGGGSTTQTIDKTRRYTVDIFGVEHPTHIGYINGYPDGSVRPEGDITREEMAAILHRISPKMYDEPFVFNGDAFSDVDASRWSAKDIEYMSDNKIILGYPDGNFRPANNLTRAEFAALVRRFTGLKQTLVENPFSDLSDDHWAYIDILTLVGAGLMEGYPDGTVEPESEITRAEVMTVINKVLGRNPSESYVKSLHFNPYNDLFEDKWYYVIVLEATITHDYFMNEEDVEYKWENWK